jgi:MFS superfamily sulfate permease-like transporter
LGRLPKPQLPAFSLLPTVAVESVAITMVSYAVTMSMSLIFAKKLHYEVDSNQELFAMVMQKIASKKQLKQSFQQIIKINCMLTGQQ